MRPHGSPESLERPRHRALALLQEGFLPVEVARKLKVDRRSVPERLPHRRQKAHRGMPPLAPVCSALWFLKYQSMYLYFMLTSPSTGCNLASQRRGP